MKAQYCIIILLHKYISAYEYYNLSILSYFFNNILYTEYMNLIEQYLVMLILQLISCR